MKSGMSGTNPVHQAIIHVGLRSINRSASGNKLQEHDAKGKYIGLFSEFSTGSIFWSKVPAKQEGRCMNA